MAKITHKSTHPETGHTLAHYESGAIRDEDTARLIHPATAGMITKETAPALHLRRRELSEQAAWDAANNKVIQMIEAGELTTININQLGGAPVISAAASKATELFMKAKTGREAEGIGVFLLKLLGLASVQRVELEPPREAQTLGALATLVHEIQQAVKTREANPSQVIEGQEIP